MMGDVGHNYRRWIYDGETLASIYKYQVFFPSLTLSSLCSFLLQLPFLYEQQMVVLDLSRLVFMWNIE